MFDARDAAGVMRELSECRKAYPGRYIRVNAYDASRGRQTTALSFIVSRPAKRAGFRLDRQEVSDRRDPVHDPHAYATERPAGTRYSPS